ncbi:hypothetical protein VIGAN_08118200, partial [Vigna angularis var. angularis]
NFVFFSFHCTTSIYFHFSLFLSLSLSLSLSQLNDFSRSPSLPFFFLLIGESLGLPLTLLIFLYIRCFRACKLIINCGFIYFFSWFLPFSFVVAVIIGVEPFPPQSIFFSACDSRVLFVNKKEVNRKGGMGIEKQ